MNQGLEWLWLRSPWDPFPPSQEEHERLADLVILFNGVRGRSLAHSSEPGHLTRVERVTGFPSLLYQSHLLTWQHFQVEFYREVELVSIDSMEPVSDRIWSDGLAFDLAAGCFGWAAAWFALENRLSCVWYDQSAGFGTVCMATRCVWCVDCGIGKNGVIAGAMYTELAGTATISNRFVRFMDSLAEGAIGWLNWRFGWH